MQKKKTPPRKPAAKKLPPRPLTSPRLPPRPSRMQDAVDDPLARKGRGAERPESTRTKGRRMAEKRLRRAEQMDDLV